MKRKHIDPTRLVAIFSVALVLLTTGCGASPKGGTTSGSSVPNIIPLVIYISSAASGNLTIGSTRQFTATATLTDGSKTDVTSLVTWNSSDTYVITVAKGGLVTAAARGTSGISATLSGVTSSTLTLTVVAPPLSLSSISITPSNAANMTPGSVQQFTATAVYSDTSTEDVSSNATWSSSNPAAASVSTSGLVTGVAPGATNIGASYSGLTGNSVAVNVVPAPKLLSLTIYPSVASNMTVGMDQRIIASGDFADSSRTDISTKVTWSSSDTSVATISSVGLVHAVSAGTTDITASLNGMTSAMLVLTVNKP